MIDRYERRFAADGQTHVGFLQFGVEAMSERIDALPLLRRVGLGDARRLGNSVDRHFEVEVHLARFEQTGDRRR